MEKNIIYAGSRCFGSGAKYGKNSERTVAGKDQEFYVVISNAVKVCTYTKSMDKVLSIYYL